MEVIKASPESIEEVFRKRYIIPEYQRQYAWDIDKCDILWDDIIGAFDESPESDYFLGTMVLILNEENAWEVIDGQQRLTSLLLLLKAFYENHELDGLYKQIHVYDTLKDKKDDSLLRIESRVIEENKETLKKLLHNEEIDNKSSLHINYSRFIKKIDEWKKENPDKLEKLIRFCLGKIKLLPIDCGNNENTLKIFQTLNNRGTPLNDTDILKSQIYKYLEDEEKKKSFIEKWNTLENKETYFRIYMHILRAKDEDIGNEKSLRDYFEKRITKNNVSQIIEDIKKIEIYEAYKENEYKYWSNVLYAHPVELVHYPYYVFMYKYSEIRDNEIFLSEVNNKKLIKLISDILKFVYIRGIIDKTRNSIKYEIFKACKNIILGKLEDIFPSTINDKKSFIENLEVLNNRSKYAKGILSLYHILNDNQRYNVIKTSDYHIEHILPKAWQHYDGWTEESYNQYIDSLGNLTLFEEKLNIKAKNEFLQKKQVFYKNSKIKDVVLLGKYKKWTSEECEKRFKDISNRLVKFLF